MTESFGVEDKNLGQHSSMIDSDTTRVQGLNSSLSSTTRQDLASGINLISNKLINQRQLDSLIGHGNSRMCSQDSAIQAQRFRD